MSKKKQDKNKQNITNVHDKFFKETFSRLEVAESFIEELFPQELKEKSISKTSKESLNHLLMMNSKNTFVILFTKPIFLIKRLW